MPDNDDPANARRTLIGGYNRDVLFACARKLGLPVRTRSKKGELIARLMECKMPHLERLLNQCYSEIERKKRDAADENLRASERSRSPWKRLASVLSGFHHGFTTNYPKLAAYTGGCVLLVVLASLCGVNVPGWVLDFRNASHWLASSQVHGKLVDGHGRPVAGVEVCFASNPSTSSVSFADGTFSLPNPAGPIRGFQTILVLSPADLVCLAPEAGRLPISKDPNHVHEVRVHRPGSGTLSRHDEERAIDLLVDKSKRFTWKIVPGDQTRMIGRWKRAKKILPVTEDNPSLGDAVETFHLILSEEVEVHPDVRLGLLNNWLISQDRSRDREVLGLVNYIEGDIERASDLLMQWADDARHSSLRKIAASAGMARQSRDYHAAVSRYRLVVDQMAGQPMELQADSRIGLAISLHMLHRTEPEGPDGADEELDALRPLLDSVDLDPDTRANSLLAYGLIVDQYADFTDSIAHFEKCAKVIDASSDIRAAGLRHLAIRFCSLGEYDQARHATERILAMESISADTRVVARLTREWVKKPTRDWSEHIRVARISLESPGISQTTRAWTRLLLASMLVSADRDQEAQSLLDTIIGQPETASSTLGLALELRIASRTKRQKFQQARADIDRLLKLTDLTPDAKSSAHVQLGNWHKARREFALAADAFGLALEVPFINGRTRAIATDLRGQSLVQCGRLDEANADLTEAFESGHLPVASLAACLLARSLTWPGHVQDERCTSDLRRSCELAETHHYAPIQADCQYNLGVIAIGQKKLDESLEHFKTAASLDGVEESMAALIWFQSAEVHRIMGNASMAYDALTEAASHLDACPEQKALVQYHRHRFGEGDNRRRSIEAALETCPKDSHLRPYLLIGLGQVLASDSKIDEAAEQFRNAIQHPQSDTNLQVVASVSLLQNPGSSSDIQIASQAYARALADPQTHRDFQLCAAAFLGQRRLAAGADDQAEPLLLRAITLGAIEPPSPWQITLAPQPGNPILNRLLAEKTECSDADATVQNILVTAIGRFTSLMLTKGDLDRAIDVLQQAATDHEGTNDRLESFVHFMLGKVRHRAGRSEQAIEDLVCAHAIGALSENERSQLEELSINVIGGCEDPATRARWSSQFADSEFAATRILEKAMLLRVLQVHIQSDRAERLARLPELMNTPSMPSSVKKLLVALGTTWSNEVSRDSVQALEAMVLDSESKAAFSLMALFALSRQRAFARDFQGAAKILTEIIEFPNVPPLIKSRAIFVRAATYEAVKQNVKSGRDYAALVSHVCQSVLVDADSLSPISGFDTPTTQDCENAILLMLGSHQANHFHVALDKLVATHLPRSKDPKRSLAELELRLSELVDRKSALPQLRAVAAGYRVIINQRLGRHSVAIENGEEALNLNQHRRALVASIQFSLAVSHQLAGEPARAIELYELVLDESDWSPSGKDRARNNLCVLALDHETAVSFDPLEMVSKIDSMSDPEHPEYLNFADTAARVCARGDRLGQALNYTKSIVQLATPEFADRSLRDIFEHFDTPREAALAITWLEHQGENASLKPLIRALRVIETGNEGLAHVDAKAISILEAWRDG